ncbi:glycosyltransferase [Achromobacter xylosoxidans]
MPLQPFAAEAGPGQSWDYSVLMAVYAGEQPQYLAQALASLCACRPEVLEVVLVEDGPLTPGLREVIEGFRGRLPLRSVALPSNQGLGPALNVGLRACTKPWIARFDTDDLVEPHRFERQIGWLQAHLKWIYAVDGFVNLTRIMMPKRVGFAACPRRMSISRPMRGNAIRSIT